jgi:hypothetical protein
MSLRIRKLENANILKQGLDKRSEKTDSREQELKHCTQYKQEEENRGTKHKVPHLMSCDAIDSPILFSSILVSRFL